MVAGVLLAFAAGLLFAAGNLAQKKAVDGLRRFSGRTPLATLTAVGGSWIWIAGAVLSVLGVLVQLDAYRHISIAEVQAIGGAGLAVLLVLPHVAFGERLTRREIVGAALGLVAFGLVVASMTSQGAPRARLLVPRTEIAIGAIVVVTVVLIAVFTHRDRASGAVFGLSAGLLYGAMGLGVRGASAAFTSSTLLHGVARLLAGPIPYSVRAVLGRWSSCLPNRNSAIASVARCPDIGSCLGNRRDSGWHSAVRRVMAALAVSIHASARWGPRDPGRTGVRTWARQRGRDDANPQEKSSFCTGRRTRALTRLASSGSMLKAFARAQIVELSGVMRSARLGARAQFFNKLTSVGGWLGSTQDSP